MKEVKARRGAEGPPLPDICVHIKIKEKVVPCNIRTDENVRDYLRALFLRLIYKCACHPSESFVNSALTWLASAGISVINVHHKVYDYVTAVFQIQTVPGECATGVQGHFTFNSH